MSSGTVYLLHFDEPFKHARHYLGYTDDLEERLARHRVGNGAVLLSHVCAAGIGFRCVRTWDGDKTLERRLKGQHSPKLCPICTPKIGRQHDKRDGRGRYTR